MKKQLLTLFLLMYALGGYAIDGPYKSIRDFKVLPQNSPQVNAKNLQKAIDWASTTGAALFVDPSDEPYAVSSGIILKPNVSLIGANPPEARGTKNATKNAPVGSVFKIVDADHPFITVESSTAIKGIQFWYANQELTDPAKVIKYPPTIQTSHTSSTQAVMLTDLTFYGEYEAMDFAAVSAQLKCELILIENCYGYPLSGKFVSIDYCYDIPRILHCHVNPAIMRKMGFRFSKAIIDNVIKNKTYCYSIEHTDNAQLIDLFTFATYGGIHLGGETYGQLTNFNFDCVTIGIWKQGNNTKNRNWQIAQGSIIANAGTELSEIHPIVIEGQGHTAMTNVEAFSGGNGALTNVAQSQDFMLIKGDKKLTVSLVGSRMRNYVSAQPFTIQNPLAQVQAVACVDKDENLYNATFGVNK
jgi:hypothetical protein